MSRASGFGESNNMIHVVPTYECFFFIGGHIEYWENIESNSAEQIKVLLEQRLAAENWEAAEAWLQDRLICRIVAVASFREDERVRTDNGEDHASLHGQSGGRVNGKA